MHLRILTSAAVLALFIALPLPLPALCGCMPGKFKSAREWRSRFPEGNVHNFIRQKALFVSPFGIGSLDIVNDMVTSFGNKSFDFLLLCYDQPSTGYNWSMYEWSSWQGVEIIPTYAHVDGMNWQVLRKYVTPEKVSNYTHIFKFDDDIRPWPGLFDAEVYLHLIQTLGLNISQPSVGGACHYGEDGGLCHSPDALDALHTNRIVEVMVPVYSSHAWQTCIHPFLLQWDFTGWGVDLYLGNCGRCKDIPKYVLNIPVIHTDKNGLSKKNAMGRMAVKEYRRVGYRNKGECVEQGSRFLYEASLTPECGVTLVLI